MKQQLLKVLKYLLALGLGIGLLYFTFKGTSIDSLWQDIQQANKWWLLLSMAIGLLSHYIRGLRWRMQLQASGYDPSNGRTFAAVMVGYLFNQAIPRAGEVARCSALYKSDKIPIATGFGTVVVERVFDVLILLGLIMLAFTLESATIYEYLNQFFAGASGSSDGFPIWLAVAGGIGVIGLGVAFFFRERLLQIPFVKKVYDFFLEFVHAGLSVRQIKRPWLFIVYTILIWIGYWQMTYVAFFSIDTFFELDTNLAYFGLIITIMGGIGMAMPVPGGLGPYHAAVIFTFIAFGIMGTPSESEYLGQTFAIIMHASQFIMIVVSGIASYLFLIVKKPVDSSLGTDLSSPSLAN